MRNIFTQLFLMWVNLPNAPTNEAPDIIHTNNLNLAVNKVNLFCDAISWCTRIQRFISRL